MQRLRFESLSFIWCSNVVFMKIGELAEIRTGYPFRSRLEHDPAGAVVVIQMKDIDDSDLLHPEHAIRVHLPQGKESHLLQPGDLVFRSRGRTNTVALAGADIGEAVLAAPMLLIRPRGVLPAYLHWYLNTSHTQATLAAMSEGTSVRMITKEALQGLEVPVPSLERQQKIIELASLAQQEQGLIMEIAMQRKSMAEGLLMRAAKNTRREPGKGGDGSAVTPPSPIS